MHAHTQPRTTRIRKAQAGFTFVELIIVVAIIAVIAIAGIPIASSMIVKGKVEPTAMDISKTAAAVRGNFASTGPNPYSAISSGIVAQTAKGIVTSLSVNGTSTFTLTHDLGTTGGTVSAASAGGGSSFTITVPTVNDAACPGLASVLSRSADVITVNGTSAKASGGTYNAATAQGACTSGDTNSFVFTFS